jgi:energy-coupling factor transporter ATP-binding protein EcfA2
MAENYTGFKIKETKKFNEDCVPVAYIDSGFHKGSYVVMCKGKGKPKISVDGELIPVEMKGLHERITAMITGPSGSGKSTIASKIAKQYKKMHPSNPIVLISPKEEDKVLDRLNPIRIGIRDDNFLGEEPIELDELENSLVILDDCEALCRDKQMMNAVNGLRDQILTLGRSKKISCIVILHQTTNRKETAIPIIESSHVTIFPQAMSYQVTRLLRDYMNIDQKAIKKLKNIPSRTLTLHKFIPMLAISKDEVCFINDLEEDEPKKK